MIFIDYCLLRSLYCKISNLLAEEHRSHTNLGIWQPTYDSVCKDNSWIHGNVSNVFLSNVYRRFFYFVHVFLRFLFSSQRLLHLWIQQYGCQTPRGRDGDPRLIHWEKHWKLLISLGSYWHCQTGSSWQQQQQDVLFTRMAPTAVRLCLFLKSPRNYIQSSTQNTTLIAIMKQVLFNSVLCLVSLAEYTLDHEEMYRESRYYICIYILYMQQGLLLLLISSNVISAMF